MRHINGPKILYTWPLRGRLSHSCRAEGFCDGQFGTGFENTNYWYTKASATTHPVSKPLVLEARRLAAGMPLLRHVGLAEGG